MEGDIMVGGNVEEASLTLSQYGSGLLGSMVGDVRQPTYVGENSVTLRSNFVQEASMQWEQF